MSFGLAYGASPVTSITDRQITCRLDRDSLVAVDGNDLPRGGYGMGGMSGGPLLVPEFKNGDWEWRLGGVISQAQPDRRPEDVLFESVVSHRAEFILADGMLAKSL